MSAGVGGHLDLPAGGHQVEIVAVTEGERSPGATALRGGPHNRRPCSRAIASAIWAVALLCAVAAPFEADSVLKIAARTCRARISVERLLWRPSRCE
jgi:hypothetical protein